MTLFSNSKGLDLRALVAAIALLGSLPGIIAGSLILPKIQRQKRWQFSFLSFGIAYAILLVVVGSPLLPESPQFVKAQAEQAPLLGTLIGHSEKVTSLEFSPNGEWLVSGGKDNAIRYWQLSTGNLLKTIRGDRRVDSLTVTPDGQHLISSGATGVKIRQLGSGEILKSLEVEHSHVFPSTVITSDRGQLFIRGFRIDSVAKHIDVWQWQEGKWLQTIKPKSEGDRKERGFVSMVVSLDGNTLITGRYDISGDDSIQVYELNSEKRLYELTSKRFAIPELNTLAITPNSQTLISLSGQTVKSHGVTPGKIQLWDVRTRRLLHTLPCQGVRAIAVSPDGRWLVGAGNSLRIWQLNTGKLIHSWNIQSLTKAKERSWIHAIAISPDGKTLATTDDKVIRLWSIDVNLTS
ncbi:MAG: PD40 domain-containing protein [Oscillatoriales cyanobacterium C42_A2020_001]|nr:PD40 domain-containing protein [Leptolyngbyaceae cyanobacterium C42_A2020_001]